LHFSLPSSPLGLGTSAFLTPLSRPHPAPLFPPKMPRSFLFFASSSRFFFLVFFPRNFFLKTSLTFLFNHANLILQWLWPFDFPIPSKPLDPPPFPPEFFSSPQKLRPKEIPPPYSLPDRDDPYFRLEFLYKVKEDIGDDERIPMELFVYPSQDSPAKYYSHLTRFVRPLRNTWTRCVFTDNPSGTFSVSAYLFPKD